MVDSVESMMMHGLANPKNDAESKMFEKNLYKKFYKKSLTLDHGRTEEPADVVSIHDVLFALNKDQLKYVNP